MAEYTNLYELANQAGAAFVEKDGWFIPRDFGDPAAEYHHAKEGAALFDVSSRSKIELMGNDAGTFLHNLCTNDVKNLQPGFGCEAFSTNIKAKVIAHVFIYHIMLGDKHSYWLDAVPGRAETIIK